MRWIALMVALSTTAAAAEIQLFDWSEDACAQWDIPDAPARFWREGVGVAMIAGSEASRISTGPTMFELERRCDIVYSGNHNSNPGHHDDRAWIHSVWSHADGRVEALVHVEYHGHRHDTCAAGTYMACWRNSIIAIESRDGRTFTRSLDPPVAALPDPYNPAQTQRSGYFNPSNIFRVGRFLYVFVFAEAHGSQARGACLLRREVATGTWMAWDGSTFGARLSGGDQGGTCAPVSGVSSTLSSVLRDRDGTYLAATARQAEGRHGIWLQRSGDLLTWSAPELLVELPLLWRRDCAAPAVYAYPALIAPDSPSRNFDTLVGEVWLTAVNMPLGPDCDVGPERNLVAWHLRRKGKGGLAMVGDAP